MKINLGFTKGLSKNHHWHCFAHCPGNQRFQDRSGICSRKIHWKGTCERHCDKSSDRNSLCHFSAPTRSRIDPVDSASVVPMVAGQVTAVNVAIGDHVNKGAVLFTMDQTQSSVLYNQAKISFNTAKRQLNRIAALYKGRRRFSTILSRCRSAVQCSFTKPHNSGEALSYCTVTSPLDGYVTSVNVAAGTLASQATPAVTVADVSSLEINTNISEYLVGKVKVGDKVEIYINTLSETPFSGTISALSPAPAQGSFTYPANHYGCRSWRGRTGRNVCGNSDRVSKKR